MEEILVTLSDGREYYMKFFTSRYCENENTYIGILSRGLDEVSYEMWGHLTVNLSVKLPKSQAYLDVNNGDSGVIDTLTKLGYIEDLGLRGSSGYVVYPLYDISKLVELVGEDT